MPTAEFQFSSYHIKNRLVELGCLPCKSLKLEFPNIPEEHYRHFIRGYFDGDGCIGRHNNDYYFAMMSTKNFCTKVNEIIYEKLEINSWVYNDPQLLKHGNDISCVLRCNGNRRVFKILNWLYKDSETYLIRKYNRYQELYNRIEEVDKHTNRYVKNNICTNKYA